MDIVVHLFEEELTTAQLGCDHPDRDIYFSSKGHDVPGLYAVLHSLGVIPTERLLRLRRLGGLDGHPDVGVPGIEANSGSLGMGISKGRGMAWAKRFLGRGGRVVVMTGDGELQEGQNWEALQAGAHEAIGNLIVIVDRNELQSDRPTEEILALGDLEAKLRRFGWYVDVCDGHDHVRAARGVRGLPLRRPTRPKVLVAHTIKGKGVSFMEHPVALEEGGGTYRWHAGAPDDEAFARAFAELTGRIGERFARRARRARARAGAAARGGAGVEPRGRAGERRRRRARPKLKEAAEYVAEAYGEALLELAGRHPELVVLDADLASDCRVRGVRARLSRALRRGRHRRAGHGLDGRRARAAGAAAGRQLVRVLPRLARERADLQRGERGREDRLRAPLRGPDPGRAGQVAPEPARRVAARRAAERRRSCSPANAEETRAVVEWAVGEAADSVAIRLAIGPSPRADRAARRSTGSPSGAGPCCARAPTPSRSRTGR